ncbi:MAG: FtsX-like permease family protein, partial [Blastocatellia bacterium]|nr:FtsX-like permease family protein [Blastocatellia bacterium]
KLLNTDPGFRAENVMTCRIDLPSPKYADQRRQAEFFRRTLAELRALPGVESVGLATSLPFSNSRSNSSFHIEGGRELPGKEPSADRHSVAPGYFAALGIPLLAGRDFTDSDDIEHPGVAIINEVMARRYWPNENPLGKRISIGMKEEVKLYGKALSREIVGVVGRVKHEQLKDDFRPEMYVPAWNVPSYTMTIIARGKAPAETMIREIRHAVQAIDPEQPIRRSISLEKAISQSVAPQRLVASLLSIFAGLALLLAVIGIYGVMSYSVAQRAQEIGIRMALGAESGDVLRLILRQGMIIALIGVGAGLALSLAVTRLLGSFLYGVGANDPLTFGGVAVLLIMVALLAALVPARRAAKVDPMIALRCD